MDPGEIVNAVRSMLIPVSAEEEAGWSVSDAFADALNAARVGKTVHAVVGSGNGQKVGAAVRGLSAIFVWCYYLGKGGGELVSRRDGPLILDLDALLHSGNTPPRTPTHTRAPARIQGGKESTVISCRGFGVDSGVSEQPVGKEATLLGKIHPPRCPCP